LPKPKPFANWNKKKGVESGKLVEDIRDLPPEAFQQHQLQQQQFIISSPHKLVTKVCKLHIVMHLRKEFKYFYS
jgi:hypothetical protein